DKLTSRDNSLDLSAFKLSRLFFSILSSGSSSCWRSYGAHSILSRETLPDVRSAYDIISNEESHRVASGSIFRTSQRSHNFAFVTNAPNRGNVQRCQTFASFLRPSSDNRPNDNRNRRTDGGSALVCENCSFNCYNIDRCFKIISLMSVHKVARDSKLIVAFDEMNCYVLNQDLRAGKILGTGKQIGGLYYFDGNQENVSSTIDNYVQDVNHLNFFNTNTLDDLHDIPNDEERRNPNPKSHDTPFSHPSSPSASSNKNDGGHFHDANAFANESERSTDLEENIVNSEGDDLQDHP
nr:ribonuclease H-like domain-containing protein [Tanacetum cinerariifolium]